VSAIFSSKRGGRRDNLNDDTASILIFKIKDKTKVSVETVEVATIIAQHSPRHPDR